MNEEIPDTNPGRDIEPANRVLEDPSEFYGTERVVGGEVSEVLSPAAFVISEEDGGAPNQGPEGVLVVNSSRQALAPELSVGQSVMVTGRVEEFGLEEAERETGVDLNDEALAEREGKPSIYATAVDTEGADRQEGITR